MKKLLSALATLVLLSGMILPAAVAHADTPTNLIANPSVETANGIEPADWTPDNWGTSTATMTYQDGGHTGNKSLYITMTARTTGDAKWMPDPVAVTAGQSYTYSEFYESSAATELDAAYTDANGNVTYAYLGGVGISSSWQSATAVFTVPAGAVKVAVLHIIAATGTLQTDDFSLTPTVTVTPPSDPSGNLIANPSFETANGTTPAAWQTGNWGTNSAQFSYSTTAHSGSKSATIAMTSYTDGDGKWYANPVDVTAGSTYTYSDYYQSGVTTSVVAAFTDSAGNITYVDLPDAAASKTWAEYSANFTVPASITNVTIYHLLSAVGSLTIDDVSLALAASVTPPTSPVTGNLVPNSSVETADPSNSKAPLDWQNNAWGTNTTTFSYLTSGGHTGKRAVSVKISKYTDGDGKWFFNPVDVTPDTQYQFSDYYKATVATEVDVAFDMSDGSIVYQIIGLPEPSTNWAQFSTTFTVPQGAVDMTVYHLIHSVGTLTLDDEDLEAYTPVGFNRALVSLTFDDGYDNEYTQTLPLLQKYGFDSTQFIITGDVNTAGYLTTAQVQALSQAGEEIASHTVTHNDLLTETAKQYDNELKQSQAQLVQWIGKPVTDMAFPNGLYNKAITTDTEKYYTGARGVEDGLNSKDNLNPYDIKVQNVFDTTTTTQVADWIKQAQATNTWLVLVYHSVDPTGSDGSIYNVTPAQLDDQLSAIKASGITVETMQQALQETSAQL